MKELKVKAKCKMFMEILLEVELEELANLTLKVKKS